MTTTTMMMGRKAAVAWLVHPVVRKAAGRFGSFEGCSITCVCDTQVAAATPCASICARCWVRRQPWPTRRTQPMLAERARGPAVRIQLLLEVSPSRPRFSKA